jgi:F0F1-type ATP synthase assembly protein I
MATAMRWVSEITSGGVMLALPSLAGWWLDGQLKSAPWCLIVGGAVGLVSSFLHLLRITGAMKTETKKK